MSGAPTAGAIWRSPRGAADSAFMAPKQGTSAQPRPLIYRMNPAAGLATYQQPLPCWVDFAGTFRALRAPRPCPPLAAMCPRSLLPVPCCLCLSGRAGAPAGHCSPPVFGLMKFIIGHGPAHGLHLNLAKEDACMACYISSLCAHILKFIIGHGPAHGLHLNLSRENTWLAISSLCAHIVPLNPPRENRSPAILSLCAQIL